MTKNTNVNSRETRELERVLRIISSLPVMTVAEIEKVPNLNSSLQSALYEFLRMQVFCTGKTKQNINKLIKSKGCGDVSGTVYGEDEMHSFYLKMVSVPQNGKNSGKCWLDSLFEKPFEAWIPTIVSSATNFVADVTKKKDAEPVAPVNDNPDEMPTAIERAESSSHTEAEVVAKLDRQETDLFAKMITDSVLSITDDSVIKIAVFAECLVDKDLKCRSKRLLARMKAIGCPKRILIESLVKVASVVEALDIEECLEREYDWEEMAKLLQKDDDLAEAALSRALDNTKKKIQKLELVTKEAKKYGLRKAS